MRTTEELRLTVKALELAAGKKEEQLSSLSDIVFTISRKMVGFWCFLKVGSVWSELEDVKLREIKEELVSLAKGLRPAGNE